MFQSILACICLSRRLFCVTLEISRAECNIDVAPGDIDRYWYVYRVSRDTVRSFSKSYPSYALRKHVWERVVAGVGEQR
jgi:hypothetical protein